MFYYAEVRLARTKCNSLSKLKVYTRLLTHKILFKKKLLIARRIVIDYCYPSSEPL